MTASANDQTRSKPMNASRRLMPLPQDAMVPPEALAVVAFWREAGKELWFARNADFDRRFRERFLALHERAARGALSPWAETPEGALALVLLLDQFPRNAFRGTARMYATDAPALVVARAAIAAGHDRALDAAMAMFVYLPFAHAETVADQEMSVTLVARLGPDIVPRAEHHRGIVRRFGRFPHRNRILGRTSTPEEERFLAEGGFAG